MMYYQIFHDCQKFSKWTQHWVHALNLVLNWCSRSKLVVSANENAGSEYQLENQPKNLRFSSVSNTITSKRRCFIWTFCIISMSGHCESMSHSIRSMGPSNLKSIGCTISQSTIVFVWYTYQREYWNKPCTEIFISLALTVTALPERPYRKSLTLVWFEGTTDFFVFQRHFWCIIIQIYKLYLHSFFERYIPDLGYNFKRVEIKGFSKNIILSGQILYSQEIEFAGS